MQDWYRMFDYLTDSDLMTDTAAELSLASGIRRKRPDGLAVHWNRRMIRILEFTSCNDSRPDWRETTEQYKTRRYQPLRNRMTELLLPGWSVKIVNFTVGIRGSFAETSWRAALTALGVFEAGVKSLMAELVRQCLTELNELYSTRATALRLRVDAHAWAGRLAEKAGSADSPDDPSKNSSNKPRVSPTGSQISSARRARQNSPRYCFRNRQTTVPQQSHRNSTAR
jgi:hypothetical protein